MTEWELTAHAVMRETTTSVALEALDAAVGRLRDLNDSHENIRPAFAALAEGTWWVAAIDERLVNALGAERASLYQAERAESEDGRYVPAFLWARDRHTHQLPFSMGRDTSPLFGSGSGVLHVSPGFIWKPSTDLFEPEDRRHRRSDWRAAYDELLAGRSAWKSLARCARWFHRMAGHSV